MKYAKCFHTSKYEIAPLQRFMCQVSEREYYDTTDFIKQLSDCFDIRDQQDAFEFYNIATDKLERDLKGTDQENILNDVFRLTPRNFVHFF